ncbi:MAG TPA: hypothetical protein VF042_15845 [Gemmatimonadaceae bacterium]
MRSTLSMTLLGFGVVFLSFGLMFLFLGWMGLHYNSRESLGASGLYGLIFVVIGAVLYGAGFTRRRNTA